MDALEPGADGIVLFLACLRIETFIYLNIQKRILVHYLVKMKKQFDAFKLDMDGWIKSMNSELGRYRYIPPIIEENDENIDHNYEMLHQLRAEVHKLKEELAAMKLLQLMSIKDELSRQPSYSNKLH